MPDTLPFTMSREAEEYIRQHLTPGPSGTELALYRMGHYREEDDDGRITLRFPGESFALGYFEICKRPHAHHIEIFGVPVSIVPETLERLRGKTLLLKTVACDGPAVRNKFLVVA